MVGINLHQYQVINGRRRAMKNESTAYCKKMINASYESAREAQEEDNTATMNYYISEAENYESRLAELML
tara:strand:+ start:15 stop:224 length:210 start_codon:yes stop_codon:yes gene_type:complete